MECVMCGKKKDTPFHSTGYMGYVCQACDNFIQIQLDNRLVQARRLNLISASEFAKLRDKLFKLYKKELIKHIQDLRKMRV